MSSPDLIALQTNAARAVAESVTVPWERIVMHYEILDTPNARAQNEFTFIVQRDPAGTHSVDNFVMTEDAKTALLDMRAQTASESGQQWNTCVLIIDPPGAYEFTFSYDPPKVLNGILDDEYRYYRKYLPHYLEEKGLHR